MKREALTLTKRQQLNSTPKNHSRLMEALFDEFVPHFAPDSHFIYVRETGDKKRHFDEAALESLGVTTGIKNDMPDVVIHHAEKNRLFLIDTITGKGPINSQRRRELAALFQNSSVGLIYVTAFLTRSEMANYVGEISWETEVWVQEAPTHLIHFDGERFLGPYSI